MSQSNQLVNLPAGTWQIFGDHERGELVITSIDSKGNIKGTAFGDEIISGAFHAPSGEICFSRRLKGLVDTQTYTGHISIISINVDAPQYLLAGSYITIPFGLRHRYGWYATITKPVVGPK